MTALTIIAGYIAGAFIGGLIALALWRPMRAVLHPQRVVARAVYKVGDKVRAIKRITEGGGPKYPGDPDAKIWRDESGRIRIPSEYIHAEPGDIGTVEYIDDDGLCTVRYTRKRTATLTYNSEIEPVS